MTGCPPGLEFNAEAHAYRLDGASVPSVTDVLKAALVFAGASVEALELALARGTAVHKAIELEEEGTLDPDSVDHRVLPYLSQYRLFRASTRFQVMHCELPVASRTYGYAGTLDLLGELHSSVQTLDLIDVKTGAALPVTVGPQTAGYAEAVRETLRVPLGRRIRRFALHLTPRSFKLEPLRNDAADRAMFLSAVNLWRWTRENKLRIA